MHTSGRWLGIFYPATEWSSEVYWVGWWKQKGCLGYEPRVEAETIRARRRKSLQVLGQPLIGAPRQAGPRADRSAFDACLQQREHISIRIRISRGVEFKTSSSAAFPIFSKQQRKFGLPLGKQNGSSFSGGISADSAAQDEQERHGYSMVNSRAKCLATSHVLRDKSYNSCLIVVSYKILYYYVVLFSFLLFLT